MATTGWLYATTASGGTSPTNATGAPNGTTASIASWGTLSLAGFGVQAAMGGTPPTSIDNVTLSIVARDSSSGYWGSGALTVNGTAVPALDAELVTATLATYTVSLGALTWAQLGALAVDISQPYSRTRYVDSVGVQVTYTTTVDHPMGGSIPVVSTVTGALGAAVELAGTVAATTALAATLDVLPGGLSGIVAATTTVTGSIQALAELSGAVGVQSGVTGALTAQVELSGTIPVVSTVAGVIERVEIRVIREPARTLDQLLTGSHRREDHVIILTGERAGEHLPIIGGSLTLDEAADVRATGTIQLPPEPWLAQLLDPLYARTELAVVLAVRGDDDELHTWQRAVVHPTEQPAEVSAESGLSLSVQVADRSDWVRKAGMRQPYAGAGSQSIMSHALSLVALRAPWLPIGDVTDPGYRSGTDLHVGGLGDDPWKLAVQLAWSVGQRLYVDASGYLASQATTASDDVVARWVAGERGCLVSAMSTSRSDADVCNVLGVPWEEAKPDDAADDWVPRSGVEWWVDDTSPLGVQGPLGERVRAYSGDSSVIHSAAHARDVAVSHGLAQQGALLPLDFAVRADPRLDVGSTVLVHRPEIDVAEVCRISSLQIELGGALMAGSMGERRIR